jgi:SRSO17 transposase
VWDHDAVRDDVRDYLVEHLGDPEAVLVVDETGDLKKGTATVGVQRQYTGTAGRIENAQVAAYLVDASRAGHALIDRELYLPQGWIDDPDRLRVAGVPAQAGFATKPALAAQMIGRALDAGVPAAWVAGDEVYGANPALRAELQARSIGYVLAVACDHPVVAAGDTYRADALLRDVPARAWQQLSCGNSAKGHRYYDWAFLRLDHDHDPAPGQQHGQHWLLVRRNQRTGERACYRCWMPRPVPLAILVRVAGTRWTVEERFQTGKGLCGLDQHQLRRWRSWYRWATLAMLAPRLPGRGGHDRTQLPAATVRAHPADLQRGSAPVRPPGRRSRAPVALVSVAAPPSGPRPHLPPPTPDRRLATMKVTISGRTQGTYTWRM